MHQEYPSTPDEAFERDTEGCWYTTQLAQAYADNRVTDVPWDPRYPVDTWWDLGGDGTPVVYTQRIGPWTHVIDYRRRSPRRTPRTSSSCWKSRTRGARTICRTTASTSQSRRMPPERAAAADPFSGPQHRDRAQDPARHRRDPGDGAGSGASLRQNQGRQTVNAPEPVQENMVDSHRRAYTEEPVHDVHSHGSDALRQWGQTPISTHVNMHARQRSGV